MRLGVSRSRRCQFILPWTTWDTNSKQFTSISTTSQGLSQILAWALSTSRWHRLTATTLWSSAQRPRRSRGSSLSATSTCWSQLSSAWTSHLDSTNSKQHQSFQISPWLRKNPRCKTQARTFPSSIWFYSQALTLSRTASRSSCTRARQGRASKAKRPFLRLLSIIGKEVFPWKRNHQRSNRLPLKRCCKQLIFSWNLLNPLKSSGTVLLTAKWP